MLEFYDMPTKSNQEIITESYRILSDYIVASDTLAYISPNGCTDNRLYEYMYHFTHIERLHLINSEIETVEHRNRKKAIIDASLNSRVFDKSCCGMIVVENNPMPTVLLPSGCERQHLTAAERVLNQGRGHNLQIFTAEKSNYLFVATNKPIKYETYLKLDLLMWQLIKEKLPNYRPEIEEMIAAFITEDIQKYTNAFERLYYCEDLQEIKYKPILEAFKIDKRIRINECERYIAQCRRQANDYRAELCRAIRELEEYNERLDHLMSLDDNIDTDILKKYMIKSPYIKNVYKTSEQTIRLFYEAPLLYFDEYILEKIIDKSDSPRKEILTIFAKNKFELIANCEIEINTHHFNVYQGKQIGCTSKAIAHPHIDCYSCFGNHSAIFAEIAESGDYLMLLEEITQAVLNLNFSDGIVINNMINMLMQNYDEKWWRHKETKEMFSTNELVTLYEKEE